MITINEDHRFKHQTPLNNFGNQYLTHYFDTISILRSNQSTLSKITDLGISFILSTLKSPLSLACVLADLAFSAIQVTVAKSQGISSDRARSELVSRIHRSLDLALPSVVNTIVIIAGPILLYRMGQKIKNLTALAALLRASHPKYFFLTAFTYIGTGIKIGAATGGVFMGMVPLLRNDKQALLASMVSFCYFAYAFKPTISPAEKELFWKSVFINHELGVMGLKTVALMINSLALVAIGCGWICSGVFAETLRNRAQNDKLVRINPSPADLKIGSENAFTPAEIETLHRMETIAFPTFETIEDAAVLLLKINELNIKYAHEEQRPLSLTQKITRWLGHSKQASIDAEQLANTIGLHLRNWRNRFHINEEYWEQLDSIASKITHLPKEEPPSRYTTLCRMILGGTCPPSHLLEASQGINLASLRGSINHPEAEELAKLIGDLTRNSQPVREYNNGPYLTRSSS